MLDRLSLRSKILAVVLIGLAVALGLAAIRTMAVPSAWWAARAAWVANRVWADQRGLRVEIGQLAGSPLSRMTLVDVRVAPADSGLFTATVDTVRVDPALLGFLRGRVVLDLLALVSPEVSWDSSTGAREPTGGASPPRGRALEVRRLVLSRGRLEGSIFGGDRQLDGVDVDGYLRVGGGRLAVRFDRGRARLSAPTLEVESISGWILHRQGVLRPKLTVETGLSNLSVRGEIHLADGEESRVRVGFHDLDLGEARRAYPKIPDWVGGWLSGAVYFTGSGRAWEARVSLQGEVSHLPSGELRGTVSRSGQTVTIPDLTLATDAGRLEVDRLRLGIDTRRFEGRLRITSLNVASLREGVGYETDLNAGVSLSGGGLGRPPLVFRAAIDLEPGVIMGWTVEGGRVVLEGGPDHLEVSEAALDGPGWSAQGLGTWTRGGARAGTFSCQFESLAELGRALQTDAWGRGTLRCELSGTGEGLAGRAALDVEGAQFGAARADTLLADVVLGTGEGAVRGSWFVDARGVSRGSLGLRKVVANAKTAGRDIEEFQLVGQVDSMLVQLEGAMTGVDGERVLSLARADVSTASRLWQNDGPVEVVLSEMGWRLQPARWRCSGGVLEVSSEFSGDEIRASLEGRRVCLGALADVALPGRRVDGTADLAATLGGTLAAPRLEAVFSAKTLALGRVRIDSVAGALHVGPDRVEVDSLSIVAGVGRGRIGGTMPLTFALGGEGGARLTLGGPGTLTVRATEFPLEALAHSDSAKASAAGRLNLEARVFGEGQNPQAELDAEVQDARLGSFTLGQVSVRAGVRDRTLTIDEVRISKGRSTAHGSGTVALEPSERFPWLRPGPSGLSLRMVARGGPLTFLPSVQSAVFKRSSGSYDLDVTVEGSPADPFLAGTLLVRDGRILIGGLNEEIVETRADVTFEGHRIRVNRLVGRLGEGTLEATAWVDLDSLRAVDYRVRATGKKAGIRSLLDEVTAIVDADILVRPDTTEVGTVAPHFAGRIGVHQAEITRNLGSFGAGGPSIGPIQPPTWTADLSLEAGNNVWVRNADAEVELEGSVLVRKDAQGTRFLGDLQTVRGRYFLYNSEFDITSGSLEFADVNDIRNARIEVLAETQVPTEEGLERISLEVSGTIAKPYLAATSESGYSEPEMFRLLTLGGVGGEEQAGSPFSRALARSWGRVLARRFGSEVARSLGLDEVEFEPGPGEPGDREFVEGARVGVGKYVSDRLYLKYRQSLAVNPLKGQSPGGAEGAVSRTEAELPDRQLILEYRLSRSFSLDGEASVLNGKPYFNFDVKFRHRY